MTSSQRAVQARIQDLSRQAIVYGREASIYSDQSIRHDGLIQKRFYYSKAKISYNVSLDSAMTCVQLLQESTGSHQIQHVNAAMEASSAAYSRIESAYLKLKTLEELASAQTESESDSDTADPEFLEAILRRAKRDRC